MEIPLAPTFREYIGWFTDFQMTSGKFGEQIQAYFQTADPNAVTQKSWWFPPVGDHGSKWMNLVESFARVKGVDRVQSLEEMKDVPCRIQEKPQMRPIRDEAGGWGRAERNEPVVVQIYSDKETAFSAWAERHPADAELVSPPQPAAPVTPPEPETPPVPDSMLPLLKKLFVKAGGDPEKFWEAVKDYGFSKKDVLEKVS